MPLSNGVKNAVIPSNAATETLPNKGASSKESKSSRTTIANDLLRDVGIDAAKSDATSKLVDSSPTTASPTTIAFTPSEPNPTSTSQPLPVQIATPIDAVPPNVVFTRLSPTASIPIIGFVITGNETLACDTLSSTPGVDFDLVGITSILSITQTSLTTCDVSVRSSAEANGVSVESRLEKSATFSIADVAGNSQTALSTALQSTLVTILGAPSVATAPGVTSGNSQVTVTWSAAAANGSPVSGYNVQKSTSLFGTFSDAVGCVGLAVVLSCVASGLTNGVTYYFQVTASNGVGVSVASASSLSVTPATVPSAMAAPGVTSGNSQVTVTWSAAVANGSPVSGYNVQKSTSLSGPFSDAVGCVGLAVVLSCVASGLTNGVTYYFQVTASNGVGVSVASASSLSVTPEKSYSVGVAGPGGGRVFYVAPSGTTFACGVDLTSRCTYLEVAPIGWSVEVQSPAQVVCSTAGTATADPGCAWSGNTTGFIGTTSASIGTGLKNTLAIIAQASGGSTAGRAATVSQGYHGGGLTDWYLPTINELNALCAYARGGTCTTGSLVVTDYGFFTGTYQTSWEITATCQRYGYLTSATQGNCSKTSPARVRPIRAF